MHRSLLLVLTLLAFGCGAPAERAEPAAEPAFPNARPGVAYVGDAACFDCHEDEYRGYQEHGMARSFYPLTPENAVEDFSGDVVVHHEATGYSYRPFRRDGRFYQEEYRLDEDGRRSHELVREIRYVVGSGTAARTYLAESEGRLHEMPLTWYTQAERWDFSPGYAERNARFDRLIPDRCMACHNSYPETVPHAEGKYLELPEGIGCERCHGPGEMHVEARLASPEAPGGVDSTIVNPAHLWLDRRLDVCQQCHLQTDVSVLRAGADAFGYRPSQPLASYVALYRTEEEADPAADERIGVISHADRMKQSACFLETVEAGGVMDCTTCHDPHEGFRDAGPAYFNATCLDCHAVDGLQQAVDEAARALHTAESNCFSCHMPKVEAEDAPHASFTDHLIRVVEDVPAPPADAPRGAGPVELVSYYEAEPRPEAEPIYRGMAYVVFGHQNGDSLAIERGIALLDEALAADPEHGEAQYLLGYARLQLGRVEAAIPALEQAVRLDADVPERLNALAQAYEAAARDPQTITRLYERALTIQPALADVRVNYGRFLETRGDPEAALAQYRRAVEERPWLATAHYNLGTLHLRQGRQDAAEAALRRAVELDPGHVEARGNLGLLYAVRGEVDRARDQFEAAVAAAPDHPVALGNLGAFHLNQGDPERAVPLLERAVRLRPGYVDGLVNLALAHLSEDRPAQARRYAERALAADPSNARARQILGAL